MEIIAVMMGLETQWLMDRTGVDLPAAVELLLRSTCGRPLCLRLRIGNNIARTRIAV